MRRRQLIATVGSLFGSGTAGSAFAQAETEDGLGIPDLVIFIPGIMGSSLERDGKVIWGGTLGFVKTLLLGGDLSLDFLRLPVESDGGALSRDGVHATALFPDVHLIPGLWKIDGYDDARRRLIESLGLKPGLNYFEFPYDWRRDNRVNAKILQTKSGQWLEGWRKTSNNPSAKLIIVAHSMGGLLARYFVEVLNGWRITSGLITFGTPFRGAPKVFMPLVNRAGFFADLNSTIRTFDSCYQLLPTFPFVKFSSDDLRPLSALSEDVGGLSIARFKELGSAFHEEVRTATVANMGIEEYRANGPELVCITGMTHPTVQGATIASGVASPEFLNAGRNYRGDGTVPGLYLSDPFWYDRSRASRKLIYSSQLHGSMQSDPNSVNQVVGFARSQPPLDVTRGFDPKLELSLPDTFRKGELCALRVGVRGDISGDRSADSLSVSVADTQGGTTIYSAVAKLDRASFSIPLSTLDVGVYRYTARTFREGSVFSDVFAVTR